MSFMTFGWCKAHKIPNKYEYLLLKWREWPTDWNEQHWMIEMNKRYFYKVNVMMCESHIFIIVSDNSLFSIYTGTKQSIFKWMKKPIQMMKKWCHRQTII